MRTIKVEALNRGKVTSSDLTPSVAVSDNHLLVGTHPSSTGPFESNLGELPSIVAKSFRMTNHGSADVLVNQRIISFNRYFDSTSFGMERDSPSIQVEGVQSETPIGKSQVLQLTHIDDTSVFTSVPAVIAPNLTYRLYFKNSRNNRHASAFRDLLRAFEYRHKPPSCIGSSKAGLKHRCWCWFRRGSTRRWSDLS